MAKLILEVELDASGAIKGLNKVDKGIEKVGKEAEKTTPKTKGLSKGFASMALRLGGAAGLIALFKGFFVNTVQLNKGLREIGTLMGGLSKGEMKAMADELREVSVRSGQALDKLVKARYDIVSAGFSDAADSARVLAAAADLATAGVSDVAQTADLLTTVINSWNLSSEDAAEVNDKLFTIVKLGKTTITELATTLGPVAAVAGQVGVSLDEVGAAVAVLTAGGQSTARAMTSLQGAITNLITPTDTMAGQISALGFESGLALVKAEGLQGSIQLLTDAAQKNSIPITKLFSSVEGLRAVLPLTGTAADGFTDALKDMRDEGTEPTAEALEEMAKSADFQITRMKAAFAALGTIIGGPFVGAIARAAEALTNFFNIAPPTAEQLTHVQQLNEEIARNRDELAQLNEVVLQDEEQKARVIELLSATAAAQLELNEVNEAATAIAEAERIAVEAETAALEAQIKALQAEAVAAKKAAKAIEDKRKVDEKAAKAAREAAEAERDRTLAMIEMGIMAGRSAEDVKSAARGSIKAVIAQAISTQFLKILTKVPWPANVVAAAVGSAAIGAAIEVALPKFADGTMLAAGGASIVGERGPEIKNLNQGDTITPAPESETAIEQGRLGGTVNNFDMRNSLFAADADRAVSEMVERASEAGQGKVVLKDDNT